MTLRDFAVLLSIPHKRAHRQLIQECRAFCRLHFLSAALDAGLLQLLRKPTSRAEIKVRLGISHEGLLESFLEMGVVLGEFSEEKGRYSLGGRLATAMASEDGEAMGALLQEYVQYHGTAFQELPHRLRGGPPGDFLNRYARTIAKSSRVAEPFLKRFVQETVRRYHPQRLLEIGCGTGIYLKHASEVSPKLGGVGIDIQESVVRLATENLSRWGLEKRFRIFHADARRLPDEVGGPFDMVTLYQNVYYFPPEERIALFRGLKARCGTEGRLVLATMCKGRTLAAIDFDLALMSTAGCTPLPAREELEAQVKTGGFGSVESRRLIPGESFFGFVAS